MKCIVCKYKNAALEAERHANGTTIFFADALRRKASDGNTCDDHKLLDVRGKDLSIADKSLSNAKSYSYIPLEYIWNKPIWVPKTDRE